MLARNPAVRLIPSVLVSLVAAACTSTSDIRVSAVYGPGVKLDGIGKTYNWVEHVWKGEAPPPELDELIRSIVERHLARRGFSVQPGNGAEFYLAQYVSKEAQSDFSVNPHGEVYEKGSLFLEVIDPATRKLIWRGVALAKIDKTLAPEMREQRLDVAVGRLLEKFPAASVRRPRG